MNRRARTMEFHPVHRSICLHGAPGAIWSAAASADVRVMNNPRERGAILVQDEHADDLLTYLEGQGWTFHAAVSDQLW